MSNSIAPGSSADVNVKVTALTTNPNVPAQYKTIILKKNLVNGVNTLTQAMLSEANMKYVIKYDYTLADNITIPANCILEFDGGSISANGSNDTITGNNTSIEAGLVKIFNTDVTLAGSWNVVEAYPEWFGAIGDLVNDDTASIQAAINFLNNTIWNTYRLRKVKLGSKTYKVSATLIIDTSYVILEGSTDNSTDIRTSITSFSAGVIIRCKGVGINLYNISFIFDTSVTINSSCKCVLYKSTDNTPGEEEYYLTDTDATICGCGFSKTYTCVEYWGVQGTFVNNSFGGIIEGGRGIDIYKYSGGNRPAGGTRCYRIWNNSFHSINRNAYKIRNNADDGYGFSILNNFDDSMGTFFYGNLIQSVVSNNNCFDLSNNPAITALKIVDTIIDSNKFECRDPKTGEQGITGFMPYCIKCKQVEDTIISNNIFGKVTSAALIFDCTINVSINCNIFGRTEGNLETDSDGVELLVKAIIYLSNKANRHNTGMATIRNNIFKLKYSTDVYIAMCDTSSALPIYSDNIVVLTNGAGVPVDNNNNPIYIAACINGSVPNIPNQSKGINSVPFKGSCGQFSKAPTSSIAKGYSYFATDKGAAGVGAMIYYTEDSTTPWVYADGTAVS